MEQDIDNLKVRMVELSSKLETEQQRSSVLKGQVQVLVLAREQQRGTTRTRSAVPTGTRDSHETQHRPSRGLRKKEKVSCWSGSSDSDRDVERLRSRETTTSEEQDG